MPPLRPQHGTAARQQPSARPSDTQASARPDFAHKNKNQAPPCVGALACCKRLSPPAPASTASYLKTEQLPGFLPPATTAAACNRLVHRAAGPLSLRHERNKPPTVRTAQQHPAVKFSGQPALPACLSVIRAQCSPCLPPVSTTHCMCSAASPLAAPPSAAGQQVPQPRMARAQPVSNRLFGPARSRQPWRVVLLDAGGAACPVAYQFQLAARETQPLESAAASALPCWRPLGALEHRAAALAASTQHMGRPSPVPTCFCQPTLRPLLRHASCCRAVWTPCCLCAHLGRCLQPRQLQPPFDHSSQSATAAWCTRRHSTAGVRVECIIPRWHKAWSAHLSVKCAMVWTYPVNTVSKASTGCCADLITSHQRRPPASPSGLSTIPHFCWSLVQTPSFACWLGHRGHAWLALPCASLCLLLQLVAGWFGSRAWWPVQLGAPTPWTPRWSAAHHQLGLASGSGTCSSVGPCSLRAAECL